MAVVTAFRAVGGVGAAVRLVCALEGGAIISARKIALTGTTKLRVLIEEYIRLRVIV